MHLQAVALPRAKGAYDVFLAEGRIERVEVSAADAPQRLALPSFADLHVHADRAYGGRTGGARSLGDAVAAMTEVRRREQADDVCDRASRLLGRAVAHGSLRVRSHVDVDQLVEDRALRGVLAAREASAGRVDFEIVAFMPAGGDPASDEGERLLRAAVETGADLIGAVPAYCPDPPSSVDALLALAARLDVPVDVHLDEHGDPEQLLLGLVAERTLVHNLEGRVTASHACALAAVSPEDAARAIEKVAAADMTVVALPALNLYLQDRGAGTPRRRGLTLIQELLEAGVDVRFGSDNIADIFYPYGDADPLEAAFLAAVAGHVDDEDALLAGICDGRSRLAPGDPADLVVLDASSVRDAIARRPPARTVIRAGRVISPDP